jgi:hypothetical protein
MQPAGRDHAGALQLYNLLDAKAEHLLAGKKSRRKAFLSGAFYAGVSAIIVNVGFRVIQFMKQRQYKFALS